MTDKGRSAFGEYHSEVPGMFRVVGEPIPLPESFALKIASIVVEWSRFEAALVGDTTMMMRHAIVQDLATEAPRNFKKKLELWHRSVITLYGPIEEYCALAKTVKHRGTVLSKLRNHLVHGTWDLAGPNEDGVWRVSNMKGLRKIESHQVAMVDEASLAGLLENIMVLTDYVFSFKTTKMLHAHLGMLKPVFEPKP